MSFDHQIRAYTDTDKKEVVQLLRLNIPTYFAPAEEADFIDYLENKKEEYFVMVIDNQIIGCGGINLLEDGKIGRISWDMLHPKYQKKGLGTVLLQYRIQKLLDKEGVEKIVVRTSQISYGFYQKNGFELKEIQKDYWAEGYDLYVMEYKILSK